MKNTLRRIVRRLLVALSVVISLCVIAANAGESRELSRYEENALFTQCWPLTPKAEELGGNGRSLGLTVEDILIAIEDRLRNANLYERIFHWTRGGPPYLSVDIDVFGPGTLFIIHVELVRQFENTFRDPTRSNSIPYFHSHPWLFAKTWRTRHVEAGPRHSREYIMRRLDQVIDEFLSDYRRANAYYGVCK